ncbi:hypothetical protein ANTPLA_LOCUS7072 [Anthophora plagiata]
MHNFLTISSNIINSNNPKNEQKDKVFASIPRNWHDVRKLLQARVPRIRLIEGQCRNRALPQAALFTETLGHSKSECRASLQLRNCRLHRPRK